MGHSIGVSDSYARFTEQEMLDDYIKTNELTVNQTVVLIKASRSRKKPFTSL